MLQHQSSYLRFQEEAEDLEPEHSSEPHLWRINSPICLCSALGVPRQYGEGGRVSAREVWYCAVCKQLAHVAGAAIAHQSSIRGALLFLIVRHQDRDRPPNDNHTGGGSKSKHTAASDGQILSKSKSCAWL